MRALTLAQVTGYSSPENVSPNLFYAADGGVVYYTEQCSIKRRAGSAEQLHYTEHTREVSCMVRAHETSASSPRTAQHAISESTAR